MRLRSLWSNVSVMLPGKDVLFGQFRLDATNECLWQGARAVSLRPKAFAVLRLLVERPGQLVTKHQVLDTVWPGTFVGDAVLKDSIRQLREALGDDASTPTYIETAHRRGYRFIAPVSEIASSPVVPKPAIPLSVPPPLSASHGASGTVRALGRDAELAQMRDWLQLALGGDRQIVFVTGEAGMGKTTLVQAFLEQAAHGIRIAHGQCLEHFGAGEAYLPVLDGLSRLSRGPDGAQALALMRQHAPTWLAQMPSVVTTSEREVLQAQVQGATRERMLREMAEAIDALTAEIPLILVLEDLHWSDYSTLDLVSYLARRRDPARLFVVGTYRPVEVILGDHPLKAVKRELRAHNLCKELALEYLSKAAVGEYVSARFPRHQLPSRLVRMVHRRTEGNPLFMVNVVQYLIDEGVIAEDEGTWKLRGDLAHVELGVPESVKQLIEKQLERLSPDERTVLEAASVVGMECSSVAIAAGLAMPVEWVETHCEELARRHQFLSPSWVVELPDGTMTSRHRFHHVLYLEVPYSLVPPMRRAQIHQRIAERGVAIYGDHVSEIASELAMHFEQSRDWHRAFQYLCQAAENASYRSAHHEATALARRGLEVLKSLDRTPERVQQEITLRMILGVSLMATKGFASAEVEQVYREALELCGLQGPSPQLFGLLWSLGVSSIFSGEMQTALQVGEQLLQLSEGLQDPSLIMEAHRAIGVIRLELGEFAKALEHLETASALSDSNRHRRYMWFIGHDCKVVSECYAARAQWALGYPDRAAARMHNALALARELSHPHTLVVASHFAAHLHQLRGEPVRAQERATDVIALADDYGLDLWLGVGHIDAGWAAFELGTRQSGIDQMRRGLAACAATGVRLWRPHFLCLLASALSKADQTSDGLAVANEALALAASTGEHYSTAELHRLKGELIVRAKRDAGVRPASDASMTADASFAEGLRIAREQGAKSWELRGLMSLTDLHQTDSRRQTTREALSEIYSWFTEGHQTADLKNVPAQLATVPRA